MNYICFLYIKISFYYQQNSHKIVRITNSYTRLWNKMILMSSRYTVASKTSRDNEDFSDFCWMEIREENAARIANLKNGFRIKKMSLKNRRITRPSLGWSFLLRKKSEEQTNYLHKNEQERIYCH